MRFLLWEMSPNYGKICHTNSQCALLELVLQNVLFVVVYTFLNQLQSSLGRKLLKFRNSLTPGRSYILKQTCSWNLQVCLSMYDLWVVTRIYRVKISALKDAKKLFIFSQKEEVPLYPKSNICNFRWKESYF